MQTQLDFVHGAENNRESDLHYEANLKHFSRQAKLVLDLLLSGQELTSMRAMVEFKIGHLARRKKDLSDAGIVISERWSNNCKTWYMDENQIKTNKQLL